MTKYACSIEGIEALRSSANAVLSSSDTIKNYTNSLKNYAESNKEGLGPHYYSLINTIDIIELHIFDATNDVNEVASTLNAVAEGYQEVIDEDGLSGIVDGLTGSSGSSVSGISGSGTSGSVGSSSGGNGSPESGNGVPSGSVESSDAVRSAGSDFCSKLSPEQSGSIAGYSGSAYGYINDALRKRMPISSLPSGMDKQIIHIHTALKDASLPEDTVVYRGASPSALGKYSKLSDDQLIGKIISDSAFISTSLDYDVASKKFSKGVVFVIEAPKGSKGAYIGDISVYHDTEQEVLFDAGQVFKVKKVSYDDCERRVIHVRML